MSNYVYLGRAFIISVLAAVVFIIPGGSESAVFPSTDVPKNIPDNNIAGVNSSLTIGAGVCTWITDLNVSLQATHTFVGDLIFTLTHLETGASSVIISRIPGSGGQSGSCAQNNISATLDDGASPSVQTQCSLTPPAVNGTFAPKSALDVFNDKDAAGDWRLNVADRVATDTGSLDSWSLDITCAGDQSIVVGDGAAPQDRFAGPGSVNQTVSSFTVRTVAGVDTVTAVTVSGSNMDNVAVLRIYQDSGTVPNEWDAADTLLGTLASPVSPAQVTLTNGISVSTTPAQYLIVYDIIPSPTDGQTLTASLTEITAAYTVYYYDDADAAVTIDSQAPASGAFFEARPAEASCFLEWDHAVDSGSGMHPAEANVVRYQQDTPPGSCSEGSQVYLGTGAGYLHSGLSNGATYYYRLCYKDALGNLSEYSGNPVSCSPWNNGIFYKISSDVPKDIPDNNPTGTDSLITIPPGECSTITDLDVLLQAAHPFVGDLIITLTHLETQTSALIVNSSNCPRDDINAVLDDSATLPVQSQCSATPPAIGGSLLPANPLSVFNGEEMSGTWILNASDSMADDLGTLVSWGLRFSCITDSTVIAGDASSPPDRYVGSASMKQLISRFTLEIATGTADVTAITVSGPNMQNVAAIHIYENTGPMPEWDPSDTLKGTLTNPVSPAVIPVNNLTVSSTQAIYMIVYDFKSTVTDGEAHTARVSAITSPNPSGILDNPDATITIDLQGPVSGTLFSSRGGGDAGGGECLLTWNMAQDIGAGLHMTEPYELRFAQNAPPGSCAGGSQTYAGNALSYVHSGLITGATYYYRLCYRDVLDNQSQFSGGVISCIPQNNNTRFFSAVNLPMQIPSGYPAGVDSTISIPLEECPAVSDVDVFIGARHSSVGSFRAELLYSNEGANASSVIIDRPGDPAVQNGCTGQDIFAFLDDEASQPAEDECSLTPPALSGSLTPNNPLNSFDGQAGGGTWTLRVADINGSSGLLYLDSWGLVLTCNQPANYLLHVTNHGTAVDEVTSSPGGISCNTTGQQSVCDASFPAAQQVRLTATQVDGQSFFERWLGDCFGNDPVCDVTMNSEKFANAYFNACSSTKVQVGIVYYASIEAAYSNPFLITAEYRLRALDYPVAALVFDKEKTITLKGGYDCGYSQVTGPARLTGGPLVISSGTVIADGIEIP